MEAAGWVFTSFGGACTRWPDPACWSQEVSFCETSFRHSQVRDGGDDANPKEENANFIAQWYNPGSIKLPSWGRDNLPKVAPRRSAWATVWLP